MVKRYDVFLSYSSVDVEQATSLAARLKDNGVTVFLSICDLVSGRPWQDDLEAALDNSDRVAVLVGSSGLNPWHRHEVRVAVNRAVRAHDDFRVIPVLLPGAQRDSLPDFLTQFTEVDLRDGIDGDEKFAQLVAAIRGEPPAGLPNRSLPDEPAPYPSLSAFNRHQTRFFFGRDDDIRRLAGRVLGNSATFLMGASGSGKSSLVYAGLLPALGETCRGVAVVPGRRPIRAVAVKLAGLAPTADQFVIADRLTEQMSQSDRGLADDVPLLEPYLAEGEWLLLVIDQFEELFTLLSTEDEQSSDASARRAIQSRFVSNLLTAARESAGRLRLLVALRADFTKHCLELSDLRNALEANTVMLGPPEVPQLREAIVRPAAEVKARLQDGLVGRILDDLADRPAPLPLLQAAMAQVWQARRGEWLTHDGYEASGRISGALNHRAEEVFTALTPAQQDIAKAVFLRLVAPGRGTGDTRRRVHRDELEMPQVPSESIDQLLVALSDQHARLLVIDDKQVELVHEALIDGWVRLAQWLAESRADQRTHWLLGEAAREWEDSGRDLSYLYSGTRLAGALVWAERTRNRMNPLELEFLAASGQPRDEQAATKAAAELARQQLRIELPLSRAGSAVFELDRSPERAVLLALTAIEADGGAQTPGVIRSAHTVLDRVGVRRILRGHKDRLSAVAFSPDGRTVLTGSYDSTAVLWDRVTGALLHRLEGHRDSVVCVAWSPDATQVATGSWDTTVRTWDVTSGRCAGRHAPAEMATSTSGQSPKPTQMP